MKQTLLILFISFACMGQQKKNLELMRGYTCDTIMYVQEERLEDVRFQHLGFICPYPPMEDAEIVFRNKAGVAGYRMGTRPASYYLTPAQGNAAYRPISYVPTFASLLNKPTTLSGYGITDAKSVATYSGTTAATTGIYSVTYPVAYASVPNVQLSNITTNPRDVVMLTSSSTTGFTIQVQRRVDVLGLLPTYSNVSGVTVNALVTAQ